MVMMDHGEHGKVMVESSYHIRSMKSSSSSSSGHSLAPSGHGGSSADPFSPHRPPRSRRLSTSGLPSYGTSNAGNRGGHAGYLPSSGDAFGLDRMIAPSPMSCDLMPYGRSGGTDLQHMPRPLSAAPYAGYGGYR